MSQVEKMSIALTPELAAAVRAAVANGEYVSSSEVVREALRDWQRRRALHQKELEDLRRLWQGGHRERQWHAGGYASDQG